MSVPPNILDHIPSFHAVMHHGSLSAAARVLRLAQPTVRSHIERMEAALDTPLFTRAANGLTPTAMAHTLLPMAEAVLEQSRALARVACAQRDVLAGPVRITCSRIVAHYIMPRLLADLRSTAPDITFEIAATDTPENLAQRAADVAIRFVVPEQQNLVAARLPDVELGLFAAPALVKQGRAEDIATAPFITDDRAHQILPAMAKAGLEPPGAVVLRCDDPLAQIAHVQAGIGIGVCQAKLAALLGLVRVFPHIHHKMPAWVVVHEDQRQVARIRHVFAHLKTALPHLM